MLKRQTWEMFDHGFSNYMKHAFPKDNLLPISCKGADWQGGVGLTLIDSLDMLLLLNRRADIQEALKQLAWTVSFDKDQKVHVFETTIRVLGGLLSGHVLLDADPGIAPDYDGLLLRLATDLGDRLLAAFKTPSGIPGGHVHLQKGMIDTEQVSCTACAGTLLLEFGLLSELTGNESYMAAAHHAAQLLFDQRSSLGLVGSGFHVTSRTWSHRDSTIGPGSDSYYEYLLKAYLMFGDRIYLEMFTELYVATMKHMQVPGQYGAASSAFLFDVHMDSGRLLKPWVSSLGAFWPAMQVLAGQRDDATRLHSNFTAAWTTWGWLPELFGADLSAVHPEDPGYNLRPEHIESTWYLKALTGDPSGKYTRLAASILQVLNHSRTACGYAPIKSVQTGAHTDLMESYFLSETVKYLYLSFVDSAPLLDHYLLSTEGHILPAFANANESDLPGLADPDSSKQQQLEQAGSDNEANTSTSGGPSDSPAEQQQHAVCSSSSADSKGRNLTLTCSWSSRGHLRNVSTGSDVSLLGKPLDHLPDNCRQLCSAVSEAHELSLERRLKAALPLLPIKRISSRRIRYRRCVACVHTTEALAASPQDSVAIRLARLNHGQGKSESSAGTSASNPANSLPPDVIGQLGSAAAVHGVALAQVVCALKVVGPRGRSVCKSIRRLTALDSAVGLEPGTLVLQLTALPQQATPEVMPTAVMLAGFDGLEEEGPVVLEIPAAEAAFSPPTALLSSKCIEYLSQARVRLAALPSCPVARPHEPPGYLSSSSSRQWQSARGQLGSTSSGSSSSESWWLRNARAADPSVGMSPSAHTCWPLLQRAEQEWFARAAAAAADWFTATSSSTGSGGGDSSSATEHGQQQQQLAVGEDEAVASAVGVPEATPALLAGCVGLDVNSEAGGTWLAPAEFSRPGSGCDRHDISALPAAAPLVMAIPSHACGTKLQNAAMVRGAIAVILRGGCSFLDKAMAAEAAGAVGVVILNTIGRRELITMSGDDSGRQPGIPAVLVGGDDVAKLLWWMERRPMIAALTAYDPEDLQAQQQQGQEKQQPQQTTQQQDRKQPRDSSTAGSKQTSKTHEKGDKQAAPGTQSKAAAAAAAASGPVGTAVLATTAGAGQAAGHTLLQTKMDLLVPKRSLRWLQDNVVKAGGDLSAVYATVLRDPRVLSALQDAMQGKKTKP
eukprot:GHUV01020699.1.p1 GENE.GHUV01020699.1~~GHUV01020699.1.p1  ORF type:complete len:1177 (+),score=371.08 GHUV01020699.1:336-3866(+)